MLGACAINKVILMGRLTRDPELRQTQTGIMSCRFTVAIDRPISTQAQQSGQERQTDFINVTAFNKTAEFVSRYFTKGKLILVEGNLKTGSYTDKNHSDVTHFTTEVWADNVSFGETKSSSGGGYAPGGGYSAPRQNYNNSYQQGYDQAPQQNYAPPPPAAQQPAPSVSIGAIDDFEEIINDNDLPF